jgi:hypothetical protein
MPRTFKQWTPATAELELLYECWLARLPPAKIAARLPRDACDEVAPSSSRRVRSVRHDARNPSRVQVVDRHARVTPGLPARPS